MYTELSVQITMTDLVIKIFREVKFELTFKMARHTENKDRNGYSHKREHRLPWLEDAGTFRELKKGVYIY